MPSIFCALLGHRRSRRRARPSLGHWRSRCHLCGTRMQRIAPGRWLPLSELPNLGPGGFAGLALD